MHEAEGTFLRSLYAFGKPNAGTWFTLSLFLLYFFNNYCLIVRQTPSGLLGGEGASEAL